jgi:hypothetical protein
MTSTPKPYSKPTATPAGSLAKVTAVKVASVRSKSA